MKTGPDQVEFSTDRLFSRDAEAIYGWTVPRTAINSDKAKHDLIVIVTEIEVTNSQGKTKTFKPGPDQIAEAIIHEIGIHDGRITAGQSDVHDSSAVIREVSEQIGGFSARPATPATSSSARPPKTSASSSASSRLARRCPGRHF